MRQYYISDGIEKVGPINLDQLSQYNLTPDTLVWCSGMDNWCHASEVEELTPYLETPPLPQYPEQSYQPEYQQQSYQPYYQSIDTSSDDDRERLTTSQQVFRGILFLPVILIMLISILALIHSIGQYSDFSKSMYRFSPQSSKISSILIIGIVWYALMTIISITAFVRLIIGRNFGFINFFFFVILLIFFIVVKGSISSSMPYISVSHTLIKIFDVLIISSIISSILAFFAAVPIEKLGSGKYYKGLFKSTVFEYILIGFFILLFVYMVTQ